MLLWINGRTEAQYELAAWHVSHLIACWSESPPSVDKLLGREHEDEILRPGDFSTIEDFNAAVEASRAKHDPLEE